MTNEECISSCTMRYHVYVWYIAMYQAIPFLWYYDYIENITFNAA